MLVLLLLVKFILINIHLTLALINPEINNIELITFPKELCSSYTFNTLVRKC